LLAEIEFKQKLENPEEMKEGKETLDYTTVSEVREGDYIGAKNTEI
jgi:hypothetical protein